jgi:hypothetical protein
VDTGDFKSHLLVHCAPLVALYNFNNAFFSVEDTSANTEADKKNTAKQVKIDFISYIFGVNDGVNL